MACCPTRINVNLASTFTFSHFAGRGGGDLKKVRERKVFTLTEQFINLGFATPSQISRDGAFRKSKGSKLGVDGDYY